MRLKNIIFIGLLLMIILTVSSVSATDNLNQTDDVNDNIAVSDEQIKEDVNLNIYDKPDTLIKGVSDNALCFELTSPDNYKGRLDKVPDGNIKLDIDGKNVYSEPTISATNEIPCSVITDALGNNFGVHNITIGLFNDSTYKDVSTSWNINYGFHNLNIPENYNQGYLEAIFSPDVEGTVTLYIDNKKISTETVCDEYVYFDLDGLKYTNHTYKIVFTSKKNTDVYKSFTKTGKFAYEFYMEVWNTNEKIYWGEECYVEISLPYDATKKLQATSNGVTKSCEYHEDGLFSIYLKDLKLGKNVITFSYPGDKKYPAFSKDIIITVNEILNVTKDVGYKSGDGIYLKLPEDAKGNLSVTVDGVEIAYPIVNGIGNADLSDYEMGSHTLKVNYSGDDYAIKGYDGEFNVVANFVYLQKVYYKDGVNVSIALPNDANGTLVVSYDSRYRIAEVVNGTASIFFANIAANEELEFKFEYVNGNYDNYKKYDVINVREDNPNGDLKINMPEKFILNGEENFITVSPGIYGEGLLNVAVDGKYYDTYTFYENNAYIPIYDLVKNMELGNHTIQFDYISDGYFKNQTVVKTFTYDYYSIPDDEIVIGSNDYFNLDLAYDATGTAKLYIDGKAVKGFMNYDDEYKTLSFCSDLSSLPCGIHDAKLVYSGDEKYPDFTKNFKLNVTYLVTLDVNDKLQYGKNASLHFGFSADIKDINITFENRTYALKVNDRELNFEIENLTMGQHQIIMDCISSKYPQKTFKWTINVTSSIIVPEYFNIIDGGNVTLSLPGDANGSLDVLVYDKGILLSNLTQKLENGNANILINCPKLGYYEIFAAYSGDDYAIEQINTKFKVMPKITYPEKIYVNQDANLTFEMPGDASGKLILAVGDRRLNFTFNEGSATASLPHLAYFDEENYLRVLYTNDPIYGDYFYDDECYSINVLRHAPNITVKLPNEIIANNYITVTFALPGDATGFIYTDDDVYSNVKAGKASTKLFISKAGKSSFYYWYSGDDKYDEFEGWINVDALPAPKLTMTAVSVYYTSTATIKVKVVDSYGKIVSGKYVAFYVNGKKVKSVKTDKKGYAILKLKKTPNVYNVKATYKGGVVTKKLTVKHLVTLKTVKVKKSSRKLVLKVTLKKGKKALKGKKITFKFNGKTYKAYTNKYGVAKVTIKKSVLKKLKVGKKVTYQATYLKDTVKKTAKVTK